MAKEKAECVIPLRLSPKDRSSLERIAERWQTTLNEAIRILIRKFESSKDPRV